MLSSFYSEEPAAEEPAAEEPAAEEPAAEEPAPEEPAAEEPAAEEPAAEEPTEEEPSADEPAAEEPAEEPEVEELEDYETPLGLPEENPEPEKKVFIFTSNDGVTAGLTSRIEGFEGYEVRYQWECDKHDGAGFQEVSGANGSSYTFAATAENLTWEWRLSVYFH